MFLGIDTSNYTTSMAVIDKDRKRILDKRIVLPVPKDQKGLQQSTAFFYHVKNLPILCKECFTEVDRKKIQSIAVSDRPRPDTASYMPVFLAGVSVADSISYALGIPCLKTTHQEGHLIAGLWSAGLEAAERIIGAHLSGGTMEIFYAEKKQEHPICFEIVPIGRSLDISAGQLIDRIGIRLGLPFPCGAHMEKIAAKCDHQGKIPILFENKNSIPSAVKDCDVSFSGAETRAIEMLRKGLPEEIVARELEKCIAKSLEKVLKRAIGQTMIKDVLLMGGVAANKYIRDRLSIKLGHPSIGARLIFPKIEHCSDNAVGVGLIAHSMIY